VRLGHDEGDVRDAAEWRREDDLDVLIRICGTPRRGGGIDVCASTWPANGAAADSIEPPASRRSMSRRLIRSPSANPAQIL
jgi:hypothetical protein